MNNIEINDELETDIENKYIKYKENVKFTTEEAIYILKRKDFCDEVENIAIENLIKENKELKELAETIRKENVEYIIQNRQYELHYIPKSKIEKRIEELQQTCKDCHFRGSICKDFETFNQCTAQITIKNLQDLMKEENNRRN